MVCTSCCRGQKQKKGLWSPDEDQKLFEYIAKYSHGCWCTLPKLAGMQKCGKSCRLRYLNYLKPGLRHGAFSLFEENVIIEAQAAIGNRWSVISKLLPGLTDNEIKNFWNSFIKKHLIHINGDPYNEKSNDLSSTSQINKMNASFSKENYRDIDADFQTVNLEAAAGCFTSTQCLFPISDLDVSPLEHESDGLNLLVESAQDLSRYTKAEMAVLSQFLQHSQAEGDSGETLNYY